VIHEELISALEEAFDYAYKESLYNDNTPQFWGIDYGNGCCWFLQVTSNVDRWPSA
jgi:hypothetical protein